MKKKSISHPAASMTDQERCQYVLDHEIRTASRKYPVAVGRHFQNSMGNFLCTAIPKAGINGCWIFEQYADAFGHPVKQMIYINV